MRTITLFRDPLGSEVACRLTVPDAEPVLAALRSAATTRLAAYERGDEVLVYPVPEDPVTAVSVGVAVVALGYAVYQHLTAPEAVEPAQVDYASPNNHVGNRSNRIRHQARVPDVYGTLRVVPDLVAVPYRTYEDHLQCETVLACVGVGQYSVTDLREGDVPLENLEGYGADVYAPGTWPGNGSPQASFGTSPTDPPLLVAQLTVPEDELAPPNAAFYQGAGNVRLKYPDQVVTTDSEAAWDEKFPPGTMIRLVDLPTFDPPDPDGGGPSPDPAPFTISEGPYEVESSTATVITLVDPHLVDSDWNRIDDFATNETPNTSATVEEDNDDNWLGPVFVTVPGDRFILSVVAPDGIYRTKADGTRVAGAETFWVRVTQCDEDGTPLGGPEPIQVFAISGSSTEGGLRGKTVIVGDPIPLDYGYYQIEVRRSGNRDNSDDSVVDALYWGETYIASEPAGDFGDVTLIHARAKATAQGRVDKFQLSAQVTRKLVPWNGTTHTGTPTATASAARAAAAICLDPHVGGLAEADCDFPSLYAAEAAVQAWFDHATASQFSYTFDSENMGFEEMLATALRAGFMTVYRDGPLLKFRADLPSQPTLLLNSRVVVPGSQTAHFQFGPPEGEHDGVELRYVDSDTGEQLDLLVPHDDVSRPRKLETAGVTDVRQARYHAWREWNRLRYVRETASVTVTGEGQLAQVGDVVLLADLLRPGTRHGEAVSGTDTFVETPRDESGVGLPATLYLQLNDGTVASGEVTSYSSDPPGVSLDGSGITGNVTTGEQAYARATYTLVPGAEPDQLREYEVVGRSPSGREWALDLVQHTFMRFSFDRLCLWLPLTSAIDWGPEALAVTDASASYATDAGRDGSLVRVGAGTEISVTGLSLALADGVSVGAWLRSDAVGTVFSADSGALALTVGPGGSTQLDADGQTRAGTRPLSGWSHVAFTVGGGTAALYVDGVQVGDALTGISLPGSHVPLLLDLVGRASDLRVWRSTLGADDVRTLVRETRVSVVS